MNMTALLLSTALAFFTGAQDAAPKLAELARSDAFAMTTAQETDPAAESQPGDQAEQPASEQPPMEQAVEPERERVEPQGETEALDPLPEPEAVDSASAEVQADSGARRAAAWFDGLETLRTRFIQTAPDGTLSAGELSLQRPGRARFDYDDPSPILLVADGATVAIADFQLETIDRAPIRNTPMRFLLSGTDQLFESVTEAGRSGGRLYVTLVDPDAEVDGRLTLVFDDPDPSAPAGEMALAGWFAVDAMGGLTEVNLTELERGVSFDPRLFILDDEDVIADDRRTRRR
ncbi:outer-membrane lipoprotein carrier protein LolA [Maricaulaceae bacterium MS644]